MSCLISRKVCIWDIERSQEEWVYGIGEKRYVCGFLWRFHVLSRYVTQLVTTKEERSWLFYRGLNSDLQIFSIHMTYGGKHFNEVKNAWRKLKSVRRDGQGKTLSKRVKGSGNFQGSYGRGYSWPMLKSKPTQSAISSSIGNYSGTPYNNFKK